MGRYTVTAPSRVLGYMPGESFEEDIDPTLEAFLLAHGHLTAVGGPSREQLDALAVEAGVKAPWKLPNKSAVVDAIEAARKAITKEGVE